jgi:predicted methyltransferase
MQATERNSMKYNKIAIGFLLHAIAWLFACVPDKSEERVEVESSMPEMSVSADDSVYATAVNNPARNDQDRQRDALRKPGEVMQFFGIGPGDTVLDLFSGGGYYSELLSYVVGDDGKVVSHSNAAYANFVGEEATHRYGDNRLPNVEILMAENNELSLPENEFDAVMMVLAYHDIYYIDPDNGWPKIDGPALLGEIFAGLRPGGVLGIVDHVAAAGAARETGNTLHRIDPDIVRLEVEKAGFVFEESADLLRNPEDDQTKHMGDPSVRGKTDRFVMRFRKPG